MVNVDTALAVQGVEKRFGDIRALAGATFSVRKGELVGLLGPNGAGKTTAIKAIAGRIRLDAGSVEVFGRKLTPGDRRADMGIVPQEMGVYDKLTARENLEVFGSLNGISAGELDGRVRWALGWSGLEDRANEPVARFSGGMKRRLNIVVSLLHKPSLVLLDEPTAGVDPQSRERIYEMLADLQQQGVSMVLTTHHLEEAERRCQRIVIIDHGQTVADGTVSELVQRTLGPARTLRVSLAQPLAAGAELTGDVSLSADRRTLTAQVLDVGRDLPTLIERLARHGANVADIELTGSTLQDVFIKLTGRELRE